MTKKVHQERITIDGKSVIVNRATSPIDNEGIASGAEIFTFLDIFDPDLQPDNSKKANGLPMRMFASDAVKIDVSKRSKEDMGHWHRNADSHEVILCVRGALRWETEMGTVTLKAGQMIHIPKGIIHRSMLCDESSDENVLLEIKVSDALTYVGDQKRPAYDFSSDD